MTKLYAILGRSLLFLFFTIMSIMPGTMHSQNMDQSVLAVQGNFEEASEMSLSWTLGDLAITTMENNDQILTQGFQQSFVKIREIDRAFIAAIEATIFPNPTQDKLNIRINEGEGPFLLELFDPVGRLLYSGKMEGTRYKLSFDQYDEGLYLLKVKGTQSPRATVFEILKF